MNIVLLVLIDLLVLAVIVLIFLKFRFDRVELRVDMRWRSVRLLLSTVAAETLEYKELTLDEREKIKAFVKCKRQALQIERANELKTLLVIPESDIDDLAQRCMWYNEAVQQFNQMLEKPLWRFVASVFRVKPRIAIEMFDAM